MKDKRIYNKKYFYVYLGVSCFIVMLFIHMVYTVFIKDNKVLNFNDILFFLIFLSLPTIFSAFAFKGGITFKKDKVRLINVFTFYSKSINEIERFDFVQAGSIYPNEPVPGMILKNGKELTMTFMDDPTSLRFEQSSSKDNKKILEMLNKELEERRKFYNKG